MCLGGGFKPGTYLFVAAGSQGGGRREFQHAGQGCASERVSENDPKQIEQDTCARQGREKTSGATVQPMFREETLEPIGERMPLVVVVVARSREAQSYRDLA